MRTALNYVNSVLSGKIITCDLVKKACLRFQADLETSKKQKHPQFYFDRKAAQHAIDFFKFLHHSKGEWAGTVFKPSPWQRFLIANLFGWKKSNGLRRFRTAYIEVARKNGKTTLLAALGLYLFFADGEPGAEVYSAATKRDQAVIMHSEATRMVRSSPGLKRRIGIFRNNLHVESTASKFEPLGKDTDSCDGLNVHGALIDELHAHKTREMWDVLETATGARRQPMQVAITTAGVDRQSICWEEHNYLEKILNRTIEDDSYFGMIYTIDEDDKWDNEDTWIKANPNLGVSVYLDDLRRKANKAKEVPAAQNAFLRKHLDVWTQQTTKFVSPELWAANYINDLNEHNLRGKLAFGGLDLSSVSDMTAWVLVFPRDDNKVDVLARFWCPEARLYTKDNRYREQYQAWHRSGYISATPGDAIDYQFIKAKIIEDASVFNIESVNVDRLFQGHQITMELADEGIEMFPIGMGYFSMAMPMRELQRLIIEHSLNHANNPVLSWMMDSMAVSEDPAGNLKPNKADSQGKIDGIVALVIALDRYVRFRDKGKSPYDDDGDGLFVV